MKLRNASEAFSAMADRANETPNASEGFNHIGAITFLLLFFLFVGPYVSERSFLSVSK